MGCVSCKGCIGKYVNGEYEYIPILDMQDECIHVTPLQSRSNISYNHLKYDSFPPHIQALSIRNTLTIRLKSRNGSSPLRKISPSYNYLTGDCKEGL